MNKTFRILASMYVLSTLISCQKTCCDNPVSFPLLQIVDENGKSLFGPDTSYLYSLDDISFWQLRNSDQLMPLELTYNYYQEAPDDVFVIDLGTINTEELSFVIAYSALENDTPRWIVNTDTHDHRLFINELEVEYMETIIIEK